MYKLRYPALAIILTTALLLAGPSFDVSARPLAATSPTLGAAGSFSILAETTITNIPTSSVAGDVGLSPATGAGIGLTDPEVAGTIYTVDNAGPAGSVMDPALLTQAISGMMSAYTALDQPCTTTYGGVQDLSLVSPLSPGVYCAVAFLLPVNSNLSLVGSGVWIFKPDTTLTANAGSSVTGGDPCNVWWRLGSAADIFTDSSIIGNILAGTSINMQARASLNGRALAQAAVTLSMNNITGTCTAPAPTPTNTPRNTRTNKLTGLVLPLTGFPPNVMTSVKKQPQDMKYAATDIMLEIPALGTKISIVGVPLKNATWDVSWLGNQAGWLEGSAFPSWNGNSVLTGHFYLASGLPGPFVNLNKLKFGNKIIVHAYGQKYTFEVRTNTVVEPNDASAFRHEEKSWLTLVTCNEYDEKTTTYRKRVVVRAVLVSVNWE